MQTCVSHGVAMYVCVWVCAQKTKTKYFAAWLRPLTNLEVPFGAGACTLELCRFIWCGEYRSAVKVSTCNINPQNIWHRHSQQRAGSTGAESCVVFPATAVHHITQCDLRMRILIVMDHDS
jgi:hypothetical protein